MGLDLQGSMFEMNLKPGTLSIGAGEEQEESILLMPVVASGEDLEALASIDLTLNGASWNPQNVQIKAPVKESAPGGWDDGAVWPVNIRLSNPPQTWVGKEPDSDPLERLLDIVMIIPFRGELDWSGLVD